MARLTPHSDVDVRPLLAANCLRSGDVFALPPGRHGMKPSRDEIVVVRRCTTTISSRDRGRRRASRQAAGLFLAGAAVALRTLRHLPATGAAPAPTAELQPA